MATRYALTGIFANAGPGRRIGPSPVHLGSGAAARVQKSPDAIDPGFFADQGAAGGSGFTLS